MKASGLNDIQKNILLKLHQKYPDWMGKDSLLKELESVSEDELMEEIDFLEKNRLIEVKWHLGGFFNARIALEGRDLI